MLVEKLIAAEPREPDSNLAPTEHAVHATVVGCSLRWS